MEQVQTQTMYQNLTARFHRVLYEASDSRILEHLLTDFHKYVKMARQTVRWSEEHRAEKSIRGTPGDSGSDQSRRMLIMAEELSGSSMS